MLNASPLTEARKSRATSQMRARLLREVREAQRRPSPDQARRIRVRAGVSRVRLAAELGVHVQTVVRWELALRRPRGTTAETYYDLLAQLDRVSA